MTKKQRWEPFNNLSKYLFWDCNFETLDFDKQSKFIMERVFTRGTDNDRLVVYNYYGIIKIKKDIKKIRSLDEKTLNFLSIVFNIPREDFLCYKKNVYPAIDNETKRVFQIYIGDIKVDFVNDIGILIEEPHEEEGIKFIGKKDIAAMKLAAVTDNGTRAKDFVDIYYLLQEMSLQEMLECYKKKYGQEHIGHVLKSAAYFDTIEKENWKNIKLFHDTLNVSNVKKRLVDEVNKYEINLINTSRLKSAKEKEVLP